MAGQAEMNTQVGDIIEIENKCADQQPFVVRERAIVWPSSTQTSVYFTRSLEQAVALCIYLSEDRSKHPEIFSFSYVVHDYFANDVDRGKTALNWPKGNEKRRIDFDLDSPAVFKGGVLVCIFYLFCSLALTNQLKN